MDKNRIEMMRNRCETFKKWIEDWMLPATGDFYMMYKDHLETMGNEIYYKNPGDSYGNATVIIHTAYGYTEEYTRDRICKSQPNGQMQNKRGDYCCRYL